MNSIEMKSATLARAEPAGGAASPELDPRTIRALIEYTSLREWVERVRELGELRVAKGVSWQADIGLIAELVIRDERGPCVLFEDIPDSLPGSRVLVNFFGGKRQNMTLGFPTDLPKLALTEAFRLNYLTDLKQIPPRLVSDGPIFENVVIGDDVDVTRFPAPIWHEGDGGRYIGTGSFNVTQDPDEGWVNCGTYRVVVHDAKSVGFYISPGKHGRIQRDKYAARGQPMPVAVVVGCDPLSLLMACTEIPYGVSEYDVIGGIRGSPVDVVKGHITGLPIPAEAEIVLEGFVQPGNVKLEGPFGEWMGYYGTEVCEEPVMDVKAIYYRNNPIVLGCPPLRPPDEIARLKAIIRSGLLRENLTRAGVPDVTATWCHEVGTSRLLLGIAIKQRYPGHATQAGHIACQCHVGAYAGRYVIVVDDDVDVSNLEELIWAMLTRSDPATSIDIVRNAWSTGLDVRIEPERRAKKDFTNSRAIIDACRPWHWRDKFPQVTSWPADRLEKARRQFAHLLG